MSTATTVTAGTELDVLEQTATLATSVAYAGASGDLNPLHYDPEFAGEVSPTGGVIAHGMYAMGLVSRVVTGFAGGPEAVRDLQVRFTRPWPLGAAARFGGKVTDVTDGEATVHVWGETADGERILRGKAIVAV